MNFDLGRRRPQSLRPCLGHQLWHPHDNYRWCCARARPAGHRLASHSPSQAASRRRRPSPSLQRTPTLCGRREPPPRVPHRTHSNRHAATRSRPHDGGANNPRPLHQSSRQTCQDRCSRTHLTRPPRPGGRNGPARGPRPACRNLHWSRRQRPVGRRAIGRHNITNIATPTRVHRLTHSQRSQATAGPTGTPPTSNTTLHKLSQSRSTAESGGNYRCGHLSYGTATSTRARCRPRRPRMRPRGVTTAPQSTDPGRRRHKPRCTAHNQPQGRRHTPRSPLHAQDCGTPARQGWAPRMSSDACRRRATKPPPKTRPPQQQPSPRTHPP